MRPARPAALLLVLACAATPLPALTVKIATLAPEGSPWVEALHRVAAVWDEASGGQVQLRVYAGGVAGDEPDMLRLLRIGQLQGAAFTQLGLGLLEPDVLAVSTPFLVRDEGELDHLLQALKPDYERLFLRRGFRLVALAKGGWVYFFAREPVASPSDLRKLKLAVPAGDEEFVDTWRRLGFNAFSLSINDLLTGLQSGMADACYAPLLAAAAFQWFGAAHFMTAMPVAPVFGGILLSERTVEQIPEELRASLLSAFDRLESDLNTKMKSLEADALAAMQRHGLTLVPVSAEQAAQWRQLGEEGSRQVIGKAISLQAYQRVLDILNAYRR
jgi:TRAP-type C4-dicarboxylate transport system substrate-binding protein